MINKVVITGQAQKDLKRTPKHVAKKLMFWTKAVRLKGLEQVRKVPGWHDEPLCGNRQGQRSIRLNRQYRAIYEVKQDGFIEFVSVEEVTPHAY